MKVLNKIKVPLFAITMAVIILMCIFGPLKNIGCNSGTASKEATPVYEDLNKDLERNYPGTPREVVTQYCKILKVIYKEEFSKEEYSLIVNQLRTLFDEELKAYNDYDTYYLNLQAEIDQYKNSNCYVADYTVESGYDIEYKTLKDGKKYAYVEAKLFVRTGKNVQTVCEEFTLRKDEQDRWRLLTWKATEGSKMN